MSVHNGHRQRLRNRFEKEGLRSFNDHEILELLLYYCIPRQDTNPIAHDLINEFGSLTGVLRAQEKDLMKVKGIGENSAFFINLLMETVRHYKIQSYDELPDKDKRMNTIEKCGEYLRAFFEKRENEVVYLLSLDAKCKLICCQMVGEGSVNSAAVPIRKIVEMALAANATSVVLAHNHPSGIALPSGDDVNTTRRLSVALSAVEIGLADHLIFADGDYTSLRQSQLYIPDQHAIVV